MTVERVEGRFWQPGSPELAALDRFRGHQATAQDYLLLAMVETIQAGESLPPHTDKVGTSADEWHASACADRAYSFMRRAWELLGMDDAQLRVVKTIDPRWKP